MRGGTSSFNHKILVRDKKIPKTKQLTYSSIRENPHSDNLSTNNAKKFITPYSELFNRANKNKNERNQPATA